ncbi:MAG: hypothetical protein IJO48_03395 [Clostridia bacterium]|nr:hypothetical protein [Clostridia bacterium]
MFNSKSAQREKELENLLMQRDAQLNDLQNRLADANTRMAEYQNREASIIGALTEAQTSSKRIIDEAYATSDRILSEAHQNKEQSDAQAQATVADAQKKAQDILADADMRAKEIVANAKVEAKNIITQAQAEYEECKQSISRMNERIAVTAEEAARRLEDFKSVFSFDTIETEVVEFTKTEEEQTVQTPEEYSSPAQLMKNIYTIQGRELPDENGTDPFVYQAPEAEEQAEAQPQTIPSYFEMPIETPVQYFSDPIQSAIEESIIKETPEFESAPTFEETPQYFTAAPSPFAETPQAEPFAPMKEPMPQFAAPSSLNPQLDAVIPEAEPEKVWTVDEVVSATAESAVVADEKSKAEISIDAELEALINDVLNNN